MSFLKIGDRAAGAIKSGGTTRRAAKDGNLLISTIQILKNISTGKSLKNKRLPH
jgi:ribonucleotide reductase alpha subunit